MNENSDKSKNVKPPLKNRGVVNDNTNNRPVAVNNKNRQGLRKPNGLNNNANGVTSNPLSSAKSKSFSPLGRLKNSLFGGNKQNNPVSSDNKNDSENNGNNSASTDASNSSSRNSLENNADSENNTSNKKLEGTGTTKLEKVFRKVLAILTTKILLSFSLFLFFIIIVVCVLFTPLITLGIIDISDISNSISDSFNSAFPDDSSGSFSLTRSNTGYWWPIGSSETTTVNGKIFATGTPAYTEITANFEGTDPVHNGVHGGIDIGSPIGVGNVIATRDGVVEYPTANDNISIGTCDYYGTRRNCNSYGNYVKINHGDGMISIYGHMYANTITVRAGDTVRQGQVIGKTGSSGNSTGGHLHFELRLNSSRVDPEDYVSSSNPRPIVNN